MFGVTINNDDAIIQSLESQVTLRYCITFKDESISAVGSNYDLWTNYLLALRCRVSKGSTLRKISTERKSCGSWTIPSSSTSSTSLTSWSSARSPPGGRRRLKTSTCCSSTCTIWWTSFDLTRSRTSIDQQKRKYVKLNYIRRGKHCELCWWCRGGRELSLPKSSKSI